MTAPETDPLSFLPKAELIQLNEKHHLPSFFASDRVPARHPGEAPDAKQTYTANHDLSRLFGKISLVSAFFLLPHSGMPGSAARDRGSRFEDGVARCRDKSSARQFSAGLFLSAAQATGQRFAVLSAITLAEADEPRPGTPGGGCLLAEASFSGASRLGISGGDAVFLCA